MTKEEFLDKLKETICTSDSLTEDTVLQSLAEWDSLAVMSVVSMVEENFNISLDYAEIDKMKTVRDLMVKVGL